MGKSQKAGEIAFEATKAGLQQRQDGSWTLRLIIAGQDMQQEITAAPMGTRYQVVAIEDEDNEAPVDRQVEARGSWVDLGPARQAGIRCKEPVFWAFLREQMNCTGVHDEEAAAIAVRGWCDIESRADLNNPSMSDRRLLWRQLDDTFQAWKALEHA